MKRLIKKAEANYISFLESLLHDQYSEDSVVDEIISDNSDCVYSGAGYRTLFFDPEKVRAERDTFLGENDINSIDKTELANHIMNKFVRVVGYYQSFSKSERGILAYYGNSDYEGIEVIIKYEISNGLDIGSLVDKLKEKYPDERILSSYNDYRNEQEVLCKLDSNNFELVNHIELIEALTNL